MKGICERLNPGYVRRKDVRCILATLGHGKDDKKVGKLFQAYSADSKVLTVQQFKSLEKKFGGNAGTEGDSKVVSGKVRVCTRDNTLFAPIMVLPLEDDGDADEHGHEDGQGKVPRVLQPVAPPTPTRASKPHFAPLSQGNHILIYSASAYWADGVIPFFYCAGSAATRSTSFKSRTARGTQGHAF